MKRYMVLYATVLAVVFLVCSGAMGGSSTRPIYPSGLAPGTRVVLLADEPAVAPGLAAGMAGTVVCCDAADCSGSVLVSWDLLTSGDGDASRCVTSPVGLYPAGSTTWVDPNAVLLGRPFDRIGILQRGEGDCLYLETEDGERFNLVIGPEYLTQWWFIIPGNRVRVRGLLNTTAPDPARACPQQDGDIYHPIMAQSDWTDAPCCDRWECGFGYGDRVVLIGRDDPNGAVDLPRGTAGTIICCSGEAENSVLVSWDLWTNGGSDEAYLTCTERVAGFFPPGSTWWVSVEDLAKYVVTDCGALQEIRLSTDGQTVDVNALGLFVEGRGLYYLPDLVAEVPLPRDQFRASGLYAPYYTLPEGVVVTSGVGVQNELAQVILHSVLLPCPVPSCCEPPYKAGDRVRLLIDEPGGARGLFADATGTVLCCNADDPVAPILVIWDSWTGGHDDDEECDCCQEILWYPETSGWWMACDEIEPMVLADLYDAGEEFRGFAPARVVAGTPGQGLVVSGVIGNRGAQPSDSFFVAIYASQDTEITQADHFIGLVAMNIEVAGLTDLSWVGEFPADIPAGTYSIGWLIDPDDLVREFSETNNTAVVEAGRLTVLGQ